MGHRLSKLTRSNRTKCEFCSSARPPSYKEEESSDKEVEKDEKPAVNQATYSTDVIFEIQPEASLLFDNTIHMNKLAIDELDSASRTILALKNKDAKAFVETLESPSSIQETKGITAVEVELQSKGSKEERDILVTLRYADGQCGKFVLTRFGPATVAKHDGIHWWDSGHHCTKCCPFK